LLSSATDTSCCDEAAPVAAYLTIAQYEACARKELMRPARQSGWPGSPDDARNPDLRAAANMSLRVGDAAVTQRECTLRRLQGMHRPARVARASVEETFELARALVASAAARDVPPEQVAG
jgi:hypothetical protein